jgi:hypothetical protein
MGKVQLSDVRYSVEPYSLVQEVFNQWNEECTAQW